MPGFVIKYNRKTGEVQYAQYPDLRVATQKRIQLENDLNDENIEVVCLTGASLAAIESTHSRYFVSGNATVLP